MTGLSASFAVALRPAPVHCPADYEPMEGLLIAWEAFPSVLTDLTVGVTTGDPSATVWVVVDDWAEKTVVHGALSSAGAVMDQVQFIYYFADTVWIRDYGPRFICEDGIRAIVDWPYYAIRPNDDAFNDYLSTLWDEAEYDIPVRNDGGNFQLFSNGEAYATSFILDENSSLTEQEVIDHYHDYHNVELTIYSRFSFCVHIDMWMLPVGDGEVIINEYPPELEGPYTVTEDAAADFVARGYTVYRTPAWLPSYDHYTYTNAVILNHQVFVPYFNSSHDSEALAVFQQAFPDHEVSQIYCGSIINSGGAIHCVVMHVPPCEPRPPIALDDEVSTPANSPITIALRATDDGLPEPPMLEFIITLLPEHGALTQVEHLRGILFFSRCRWVLAGS